MEEQQIKMENNENSFPYIDDAPTEDETNPGQYNLRLIENYRNQNRNIQITNRFSHDPFKSLSPVAPLADETEFGDSLEEETCEHGKKVAVKDSGMKLVIKGWNSSISIQGLDNKSSITFKRRCEKMHKREEKSEERKPAGEEAKSVEKTRKGKWKMLTRSILLTKSARFEKRSLDERYPKYVLLKNEEEEMTNAKENYPKMIVFNEKDTKQKSEFSFKKSFKNKTEPIVPLDKILMKTEENQRKKHKPKKALTERNLAIKKKTVVERRKSLVTEKKSGQLTSSEANVPERLLSHGQVYNEIQDIFEDTLKLLPEEQQQQPQRLEYYSSMPPQFCQLSCQDPYCCQTPKYVPLYTSPKGHLHKNPNPQAQHSYHEPHTAVETNVTEGNIELENLPFGILSSFFPRVVIMNAIPNDNIRGEELNTEPAGKEIKTCQIPKTSDWELHPDETLPLDLREETVLHPKEEAKPSLEVPQQDLTLKSKMVREILEPEPVIQDFFLGDVGLKEFPILDYGEKPKSQGSETTEYLHYTEFEPPGNESVEPKTPATPPSLPEMKGKEDATSFSFSQRFHEGLDAGSETLSLTKIGYKMYDNLTKLSLNREKEIAEKPEMSGCGCNGNGATKSPYNITLESSNSVVKVTVPENDLNFQISNPEGGDIQIGVIRGGKGTEGGREEKKNVRKEELWHPDNGGRALVLRGQENRESESSRTKGFQKLKVSLADNQEVVFSVEMNEKEKKEKPKEKLTKEMKVGTDDFDLAGGDFVCALGGNHKNLSPRLGHLLKHLKEKLEIDEKERKFLDEKINQKLLDQKFQAPSLPGVFLVKHLSPRVPTVKKSPEVPFRKAKKEQEKVVGGVREYYCEECLATMRIFEDENPSVKSMVDKFETIIQLESY